MERCCLLFIIELVSFNRALGCLGLISCLVFLNFPPVQARTRAAVSVASDPDYISALAAANRFLRAWQDQDHETGLLMLTDGAKQNISEERFQTFFSPGQAAAYEIARGKKLEAGRYAFPITLFRSGSQPSRQPRHFRIILIRTGKEDWAVDKLP